MKIAAKTYRNQRVLEHLTAEKLPKGLKISPKSWIRAVRDALGMTSKQLGNRLGVRQSAVTQLEKREESGAITVAHLRKAADALGCDLVYYFVPRMPLPEMIKSQAYAKAKEQVSRVSHSMNLEAQGIAAEERKIQIELLARELQHSARIWD